MQYPKDRLREAIKSYYYHYCYLGVERYSCPSPRHERLLRQEGL